MRRCDMTKASLKQANLFYADLSGSDLTGAIMHPDVVAHVVAAFKDGVDVVYGDIIMVDPRNPNRVKRTWKGGDSASVAPAIGVFARSTGPIRKSAIPGSSTVLSLPTSSSPANYSPRSSSTSNPRVS